MKQITLSLALLLSMLSFSQKEITLKDGTTITTDKFKKRNGKYVYEDENRKAVYVKGNQIKMVKDLSLSEDKFEYNQLGLTPYVVTKIDSLKQGDIFQKTINWIKETYKNPDKVIKTTIENEKVRFEGFQDNTICYSVIGSTSCYGATYTIEISFKYGKYKFEPISLSYYQPPNQYSSGGDIQMNFSNGMWMYKKNGIIKKMFDSIPDSIEVLFNGLNLSLETYLKERGKETNKKDDW